MCNKHTWEADVPAAGSLHAQEMWWELGLLRFLWAEGRGKNKSRGTEIVECWCVQSVHAKATGGVLFMKSSTYEAAMKC